MNKRQASAQKTKNKLVKSALELIKENGFDGINVEDITKKAGVAKGTFYTYFKRKEDIVLEISRAPFSEITRELETMDNMELIERLTHYFHRFMECVETCGINICREWIKDVIDPNHVPENIDGQKWNYDVIMLREILNIAVQNGELKENTPVESITYIIISELYGMMTSWCMSDGKFEPLDWTHKFCEIQIASIFEPYIKKWRKSL